MTTDKKIQFINGSGKLGRGFYAVDPAGHLVSFVPGKFKSGDAVLDIKPGWHWASQAEIDAAKKAEADRVKAATAQKAK